MRIDSVELFPVQSPREQGSSHRHILVRLTSDTGHTGWGEMSDIGHPPAYDFELNSLQQVLRVILLGRDPCNLVALERDVLDRFPEEHYLYSMSALVRCGVDIALHDLVGQILSLPVATLLGGQVRDRIRVCYPIFRQTSAESIARNLQRVGEKLAQGFDLFRVYVGGQPELDLRFLQALRRVYGDRVRIKSLDFSGTLHWRASLALLERLREPADPLLVESPCPKQDLDGYVEFRSRSALPVSEHIFNLSHGYELARCGAVDIFNIAPFCVGGLRAAVRLFHLAQASGRQCLIGTTQEAGVGTAAVAHLGAAMPNLDWPCDNTGPQLYTADVLQAPLRYEDGYLILPQGPGLGISVDELRVRSHAPDTPFPVRAHPAEER